MDFVKTELVGVFSLSFKEVLNISLIDLSSDFPDLVVRFSVHGGCDIEIGDIY